jgi:hypothetical protein
VEESVSIYRFKWTYDRIIELTEMWAANYSAQMIALKLGTTRSAILGKKMRLGLEDRAGDERYRRKRSHQGSNKEGRTRAELARDNSMRAKIKAAAKAPTTLRVIAREGRLVEPLNLPFGDLDDHNKPTMCRYPTIEREGQQLFCARPAEHGTSYCDDCCRVVFTEDGYERQINSAPALRQPMNGRVAKPFRMPYELAGVALEAREIPFS